MFDFYLHIKTVLKQSKLKHTLSNLISIKSINRNQWKFKWLENSIQLQVKFFLRNIGILQLAQISKKI